MAPQKLPDIVIAKVTRRIVPFMFVLYVIAYLDRINVGFAALQMKADLGLSNTVYGFGAGIFFIGYFIFEIPSNIILERVGARLWIARIMVSWGIVSASMMFVQTAFSFYLLRFLLGVAEAGFFPGIVLYLTYWFPAAVRARSIANFMTATAIAGVIGGPLSGLLLKMDNVWGLAGWHWLFLVEGVPAIILGVVVFFYLTDRPEQARWLTAEERKWLCETLQEEHEQKKRRGHLTFWQTLRNRWVWMLAIAYFLLIVSFYGINLWLPQLVQDLSGLGSGAVSALSAVPFFAAAVGMVWIGWHSDRTRERRWHVAAPAFVGSLALILSVSVDNTLVAFVALSIAAIGIWGTLGPFWTLGPGFLTGTAAAVGIALINSVGNLGGFVGPYLVGLVKDATGSFRYALFLLAATLVSSGLLILLFPGLGAKEIEEAPRPAPVNDEANTPR
jgi:ACS family tartrate transporter-like MFS transporter